MQIHTSTKTHGDTQAGGVHTWSFKYTSVHASCHALHQCAGIRVMYEDILVNTNDGR